MDLVERAAALVLATPTVEALSPVPWPESLAGVASAEEARVVLAVVSAARWVGVDPEAVLAHLRGRRNGDS